MLVYVYIIYELFYIIFIYSIIIFISVVGSMISSASAVNWHFYMDYNL